MNISGHPPSPTTADQMNRVCRQYRSATFNVNWALSIGCWWWWWWWWWWNDTSRSSSEKLKAFSIFGVLLLHHRLEWCKSIMTLECQWIIFPCRRTAADRLALAPYTALLIGQLLLLLLSQLCLLLLLLLLWYTKCCPLGDFHSLTFLL